MGSPGIYDTPPWQLPMDNPRWKPNPYGGGTPESQRTDAREYIAEKAQELAKQRAAQRGGGLSNGGVGGGLSGDTSSYMNSMLTALAYGKGQTYRDQYGPQAMAAQGAFNKPGANVPGHYWSFNPVAQGYKIQKLPPGKAFIGDLEKPTSSQLMGGPMGMFRPSMIRPQFVDLPKVREPIRPFRSSGGGGGGGGFSAPSADFNIRANLGGLKPVVPMPADPTMGRGIANELALARQRTVVNMAKQAPYSLWGG